MERLQKVIAHSGVCSRRKAEELIEAGKVKVNGIVIRELGTKVSDKDTIEVNGDILKKEDKVYYLMYKPRGVVTTSSDELGRKTVLDFIETDKRIYPVGRLDYDTTGLLILTNDGDFANILMHPSNEVEKVYVAKIKGIIKGEDITKLKNGVLIDGKMTDKCQVKLKKYDVNSNTSIVQLIIHEGRNHQVKKMFQAIGFDVMKLKREKVAFFDLEGLNSGSYRALTKKEINKVFSLEKK